MALPGLAPAARAPDAPVLRRFSGPDLPPGFQWLRTPDSGRIFSLTGSVLRLTGRESPGNWFEQALVARRQEHRVYQGETVVTADPASWQQAAGLVTWYNRHKFHAALMTREAGARVLTVISCLGDWPGEALSFTGKPQRIPDGPIRLPVMVNGASRQFFRAAPEGDLAAPGPPLDASLMSDEAGRGEHASFTGAFVGMAACDLTGQGWSADFTEFRYCPAD